MCIYRKVYGKKAHKKLEKPVLKSKSNKKITEICWLCCIANNNCIAYAQQHKHDGIYASDKASAVSLKA